MAWSIRRARARYANEDGILLRKGEEMGRFLLGSTVVMLFPRDTLHFNPEWSPTRLVCMGEMMATSVA